jgi:hypothetical protein
MGRNAKTNSGLAKSIGAGFHNMPGECALQGRLRAIFDGIIALVVGFSTPLHLICSVVELLVLWNFKDRVCGSIFREFRNLNPIFLMSNLGH